MSSLSEILNAPERQSAVIDDCVALIDAEVGDKGGLSGLAIKAGYNAVNGVRPGFVKRAVTALLPEFATAMQPLYDEAKSGGRSVTEHFLENRDRVAYALLAIADGRVARSGSNVVKGAYETLRASAKKNVEAAVPRLADLFDRHAG